MTEADRFLDTRRKQAAAAQYALDHPEETYSRQPDADKVTADKRSAPGWFALHGRIGRQTYFLRMLLISICGAVAAWLISLWFGTTLEVSLPDSTDLSFFTAYAGIQIYLLIGFLSQPFMIPQATKRLHDLNMSGWYQLLFCVPLIGLLFILFVAFQPGTAGPNNYGAQPH